MIKIRSNKTLGVFTITKYEMAGKTKIPVAKYRTNPLSKQEFQDMESNTTKDWENFLKNSKNYTTVKKSISFI